MCGRAVDAVGQVWLIGNRRELAPASIMAPVGCRKRFPAAHRSEGGSGVRARDAGREVGFQNPTLPTGRLEDYVMRRARGIAWVLVGCFSGLLAAGCSPSAKVEVDTSNYSADQNVFLAAATGDVATLKSLVAADPTIIDAIGPEGKSPLHEAAAAGQDEAVKFLMAKGADPRVTDEDGNDCLNYALREGHKGTAQLMKEALSGLGGAPQ